MKKRKVKTKSVNIIFISLSLIACLLMTACGKVTVVDNIKTEITEYQEMSDGSWQCNGYAYKYRLEIRGRSNNAKYDTTFIYLSNLEEISFERAVMAAGLSSNTEDYFKPEEAVPVDWIVHIDTENDFDEETSLENTVSVPGPYGKISLVIPEGWECKAYEAGDSNLINDDYGFHIYPEGISKGFIEVGYNANFGVCGTGLEYKERQLAGVKANIGYYDGNDKWEFITLEGKYKNIVAIATDVGNWDNAMLEEAINIIETIAYEPEEAEGVIDVYGEDSFNDGIQLEVSVKDVSKEKATISFMQYGEEVGNELSFGENFALEVYKENSWQKLETIASGEIAYNDIAHIINRGKTTEYEYNWTPVYGSLKAGDYRISIPIIDFRATGDYDNYILYAYFIVR